MVRGSRYATMNAAEQPSAPAHHQLQESRIVIGESTARIRGTSAAAAHH